MLSLKRKGPDVVATVAKGITSVEVAICHVPGACHEASSLRGSQITLQVRRRADRSQPLTAQRLPEIINEIGMGWYHLLTFIMLVFTPLAEGAGMIATCIMSTVLVSCVLQLCVLCN